MHHVATTCYISEPACYPDELDVQNFDSEFTDMEPVLTPTDAVSPMARAVSGRWRPLATMAVPTAVLQMFRGFSFVGPNVLFNSGTAVVETQQD